ncbi:uncharacterized protein LOC113780345 [Coffea eugenioides]|uniref:uncharacterized protein LOC113780345 n=1 Tax=Coffea eugenioides TaxID=49369 RepID=UPI000F5D244D|nr:uncharacterized protein LOC113704533 [Coffea arabica]XP_027181954.1 uncharacterized protein LOC113780345 [Coffea eugenioides]
MAGRPFSSEEGIPHPAMTYAGAGLSFAEVVSSKSALGFQSKSFASLSSTSTISRVQAVASTHKGEPAVNFCMEDIECIATPFQYALVGKFSKGRLLMEDLRNFFHSLDLKAEFSLGLLDHKHVLIRLTTEDDYYCLWARGIWYVKEVPMRIFKWSIDFHVDRETSVVPVWFVLPKLPIHLFHKECLFPIVACLGRPLCVDAATARSSRPNVARVYCEVDLMKKLPSRIWIVVGDRISFWQLLIPENLPKYCGCCFHQGHNDAECKVKNLELKSMTAQG